MFRRSNPDFKRLEKDLNGQGWSTLSVASKLSRTDLRYKKVFSTIKIQILGSAEEWNTCQGFMFCGWANHFQVSPWGESTDWSAYVSDLLNAPVGSGWATEIYTRAGIRKRLHISAAKPILGK